MSEPEIPRDQFIPIRKAEVLAALFADCKLAEVGLDGQATQFCKLLGSIFHFEYFAELERLKDAYHYLNPMLHPAACPEPAVLEHAQRELTEAFEHALRAANFVELEPD